MSGRAEKFLDDRRESFAFLVWTKVPHKLSQLDRLELGMNNLVSASSIQKMAELKV